MSQISLGTDRLGQQIAFMVEVDKLKEVFRQTKLVNSGRQENDAEHSWHLCLAVILLAEHANEPDLDVLRVLKMVILHDLVEIDAGDTFAYDEAGMADQHERECIAADRIFGMLPTEQAYEFRAIWDEFEAQETSAAQFALACDRFQPMLLNLMTNGASWKQHDITHDRVVARNQRIEKGSTTMWERMSTLLENAVAAGIVTPAPKN